MDEKKRANPERTPVIIEFSIEGLNDYPNRTLRFTENKLILVGENGTGKTTFSRMLAYFLTRRWTLLAKHDFRRAKLTYKIDGQLKESIFDKRKWKEAQKSIDFKSLSYLDERDLDLWRYSNSLRHYGRFDSDEFESLIKRMPDKSCKKNSKNSPNPLIAFKKLDSEIEDAFSNHVVYLPTYRRIEEEWESLFDSYLNDSLRKKRIQEDYRLQHLSSISFGMKDVKKLIDERTAEIREYSRREQNALSVNYLRKIINREYKEIDYSQFSNFNVNDVISVLNRINEDILTGGEKMALANAVLTAISSSNPSAMSDSDKILCHYFLLLRQFDANLKKKERCFSSFVSICNSYLKNKKFEYNSIDYSCTVVKLHKSASKDIERKKFSDIEKLNTIELKDLSSGEKQIVGLFSKLCLENTTGLFVFIDEPELSLSIDWQRRLLPDVIRCENCNGLFAVTHSPFIFDNELVEIVHGINEF